MRPSRVRFWPSRPWSQTVFQRPVPAHCDSSGGSELGPESVANSFMDSVSDAIGKYI